MSIKSKYIIKDNINQAMTMHADYYTNQDMLDIAIEKIFSSSWQLASYANCFDNNNIIPIDFLENTINEPLLLTKEKDKIRCISNVCTHRGHLVCNKNKKSKSLVCRYHGRVFNLDGKFKKAPGFENAQNFPSRKENLNEIKVKEWNNFIFISLNNTIDNLSILDDIKIRLNKFPFNKIKYNEKLTDIFEIDTHWAMYCENYLEGFHVPFVHKGLSSEIDNHSYETQILENGVLQYAKDLTGADIYGYYYWIFPNIMLNFYAWGLSVNIVEPISINRTKVKFIYFPIDDSNSSKEIKNLIQVELEDQDVVKSVHRGIQSRYYERGRYSPKYEKGVHYFHQLLSKSI
tara:strand:- start:123 stop:1160 length:1038 start_codon:yes stop_codon:yes gene_type:complete